MPPEPAIWFRRLVLLHHLEPQPVVIRTIPMRRGLNVVRTDEPEPSDIEPVGHDVGKTMFTRLLRYCLGEPAFCDRKTRAAVSRTYPDSYVAAELVVAGENWSVLRPLGASNAHPTRAAPGDHWETLLAPSESHGIEPLLEVLERATVGRTQTPRLRLANRNVRWLDELQWLSRDQHCHLTHALVWRDAETESGNPELQREDAAIVVKTITGLLSDKERALIETHNNLLAEKKVVDDQLESLRSDIRAEQRLIGRDARMALKLSSDTTDQLVLIESVNAQISSMRDLLNDVRSTYRVDELDSARIDAVKEATRISTMITAKRAEIELLNAELAKPSAKDGRSITDILYERCDLSDQICPIKKAATKTGTPEPLQVPRDEERRQRIAEVNAEIEKLTTSLESAKNSEVVALQQLRAGEKRLRRHESAINRKIADLAAIARRSGQRDEQDRRLAKLVRESIRLESAQQRSTDDQANLRDSIEVEQTWLNTHFDNAIKYLVGSGYSGRVRIDAKAIRLFGGSQQSSTGEALTTSTLVLGLDLACFAAAAEGHGFLPRLLILDSPREADMEPTIFGRIFKFFRNLETKTRAPNFQVIVTTTTPPPDGSVDDSTVILRLHRRGNGAGTLLGMKI